MPRRSYTAYTRTTTPTGPMHLSLPDADRTLCGIPAELPFIPNYWPPGVPHPAGSRVCRDCADWAYPQDPYRNR